MIGILGSNYDDYLAGMAVRNQDVHNKFREDHPNGAYVLDYLSSPNFLRYHQLLEDDQGNEEDEGGDVQWSNLLESLAFAEEAAKEPLSMEEVEDRFRFKEPVTRNLSTEPDKRHTSMDTRSIEMAPQNDLWGEHRVSGGSSEVGKWMEYAVFSAHAQDNDNDDEDNDEELNVGTGLNETMMSAQSSGPSKSF